jgi:Rrf2 family iron-sulfur cluster assembly transcriptional regulator
MRFSTKGRHAVMLMTDLALNGQKNPVTLETIAQRQKVSQSYLEQIIAQLKGCNLVKSTRGPGGGYSLRAPSDKSSIHEIIKAVDETPQRIHIDDAASAGSRELTDMLWQAIDDKITAYLEKITLADITRKDLSQFNIEAHNIVPNNGVTFQDVDHTCDGNCDVCEQPCNSVTGDRAPTNEEVTPPPQTFEPVTQPV